MMREGRGPSFHEAGTKGLQEVGGSGADLYAARRKLIRRGSVFARRAGLCVLARLAAGKGGPLILCYHRISDDERPLCTPVSVFEAQMAYLRKHYRPLPLLECADALSKGEALPPRSVAVTFDDGYRDALSAALPVLKGHGIPATFFVTSGFADRSVSPWWEDVADSVTGTDGRWDVVIGGVRYSFPVEGRYRKEFAFRKVTSRLRRLDGGARAEALAGMKGAQTSEGRRAGELMMGWDEVRRLAEEGCEIGCHGHRHLPFVEGREEEASKDLDAALGRFEKELGFRPRSLAFPYGGRTPPGGGLAGLAAEKGFACALTHSAARGQGAAAGVFSLGRLIIESESLDHFAVRLAGLRGILGRGERGGNEGPC